MSKYRHSSVMVGVYFPVPFLCHYGPGSLPTLPFLNGHQDLPTFVTISVLRLRPSLTDLKGGKRDSKTVTECDRFGLTMGRSFPRVRYYNSPLSEDSSFYLDPLFVLLGPCGGSDP